jgi:hypothetical protein
MSTTVTILEAPSTMKALTGIRHSRTLRNVKTGTNSIKECWPCPQQSVGRFIAKIGAQSCWEAIGPARAIFLTIGPVIKQWLDTYSEPTPSWIKRSLYMIGYTPEASAPPSCFAPQTSLIVKPSETASGTAVCWTNTLDSRLDIYPEPPTIIS